MLKILRDNKLYKYIFIIILFGLILYIPASFFRDLHWNEELKYVEVAKEMYESGNWLVPHFNGDFYTHKPPFYFWFLNFSRFLFGSYSVIGVILVSAIPAILIALLTFYFGSKVIDKEFGFYSALILMITFYFFALAITVRMDHFMGLFILASLISFYFGYNKNGRDKAKYYYFVYVFMALATWIKGPAGFLIPLVVIPVFILTERNYGEFKELRIGKGFLIFLGIMLLWLIPALISGGREYAYELLILQTFGRAVNSFAHQRPFYYYLETFSGTFLPWSFFLYSALIYYLRNRNETPRFVKFLVVWFASAFILFSAISGKLDIYLLPIYPAGAMLTAYLFREIEEKRAHIAYLIIPSVITFALFSAASFFIPKELDSIQLKSILMPTIIAWTAGGIIAIFLLIKRKYNYIYKLVLIIFAVFLLNFSFSVAAPFSSTYTVKPAAVYLNNMIHSGYENIAVYKYEGEPASLGVYMDSWPESIEDLKDLETFMNKGNFALMIKRNSWENIKKNINISYQVIEVTQNYLVIRN